MPEETELIDALRSALKALGEAERARAETWAWTGSGLIEQPSARTAARMDAEHDVQAARETLRRAREALASTGFGEKEYSAH